MPDPDDDPIEALKWLVQTLMRDLQEAKMWPIKMKSMRHQDLLRTLATYINISFFVMPMAFIVG